MPNKDEPLQKPTLKWVTLIDEEKNKFRGPVKSHATITAEDVAVKYGVPDDAVRKYLRLELEKEESCRSLPFTMIMVLSYTAMIVGHDPVVPISSVQEAIMFDIEENANFAFTSPFIGHKGIFDAHSHADIWSWFIQGLAPVVFSQSRSFGEGAPMNDPRIKEAEAKANLKRSERGLMLNFNQLIGGVRISQERGTLKECETFERLRNLYKRQCSNRVGGSGYELYPEFATAKETYDPRREFWLWAHDDLEVSLETLRTKERENWLDESTTKIEIAVPVYNGQQGVYSLIQVNFFFSHGGHIWKRIIPFSTYSQWFYGPWNIIPDIMWICGLIWIILSEIFAINNVVSGAKVGVIESIRTEYLSFWNLVDWSNVFTGFWVIIGFTLRFSATTGLNRDLTNLGIVNEETHRELYRDYAKKMVENLQEEVMAGNIFRLMLGVYPLLVVLRLFKAFSHQPRLSVVTRTLQTSFVDLLHFLFVFASVFLTFTTAGIIIFGRDIDGFTHPFQATNTCFQAMMGDFDWDELIMVGRWEAGLWFFGFMVMIVILLLNMLLAIVMDAYSEQKAIIGDAETLWFELVETIKKGRQWYSGERQPLGEIYKAYRLVKAEERTWQVYRGMSKAPPESPTLKPGQKNMRKSATAHLGNLVGSLRRTVTDNSLGPGANVESYNIVTVEALRGALRELKEWQAIDVLAGAAIEYHKQHKETTNTEEMTRIIRKVDDGTKEIRVLLKDGEKSKDPNDGDQPEDENSDEEKPKEEQVEEDEDADPLHHEISEFEAVFWKCRRDLHLARESIGDEYPEEVNGHKYEPSGKGHWEEYKGPLILKPLTSLDEAHDVSIKRVLENEQLVLAICHARGLESDKDDLRIQSLGKVVRVMQIDEAEGTLLCRVPAVGDVWFALEALGQLRQKPAEDMVNHYFGQYHHHLSAEETALATVDQSGVDVIPAHMEDQFKAKHAEALHKIHDLESELRVGLQTVAEAKAAAQELQFQLHNEEHIRLKLAQKLESLRKKVAARTKIQEQLNQTVHHQDERVAMVTRSRDDYLQLVSSLFDKKQELKNELVGHDDDHGHHGHHHHKGQHESGRKRSGSGHREKGHRHGDKDRKHDKDASSRPRHHGDKKHRENHNGDKHHREDHSQ